MIAKHHKNDNHHGSSIKEIMEIMTKILMIIMITMIVTIAAMIIIDLQEDRSDARAG